jgi:hypothetical protein
MKFKILGLSFLLLYICCSSNPDKIPEIVSQRSVYFHNISFTDIWTATENSFGNINFTVTEKIREKGLYDAEGELAPSQSPPPLMSVMIIEEIDRIKVDCIVVLSGRDIDPEMSRDYVDQFFNALARNIEK